MKCRAFLKIALTFEGQLHMDVVIKISDTIELPELSHLNSDLETLGKHLNSVNKFLGLKSLELLNRLKMHSVTTLFSLELIPHPLRILDTPRYVHPLASTC